MEIVKQECCLCFRSIPESRPCLIVRFVAVSNTGMMCNHLAHVKIAKESFPFQEAIE